MGAQEFSYSNTLWNWVVQTQTLQYQKPMIVFNRILYGIELSAHELQNHKINKFLLEPLKKLSYGDRRAREVQSNCSLNAILCGIEPSGALGSRSQKTMVFSIERYMGMSCPDQERQRYQINCFPKGPLMKLSSPDQGAPDIQNQCFS